MERDVILQTLRHDVASAKEKLVVATETFDAIIHEALSALPYPDRVQRIHTVAKALTIARQEYIRAFARLDAYMGEEIIPDNLKN